MVGPNGSGKSSVLSALRRAEASGEFNPQSSIDRNKGGASRPKREVEVEYHGISADGHGSKRISLYLRTAYRAEHDFHLERHFAIQAMHSPTPTRNPPSAPTGPDQRVQENYKRLLGDALRISTSSQQQNWDDAMEEMISPIRKRLSDIFPDLTLLTIPSPTISGDAKDEKGTFYFSKSGVRYSFPGLSAGEREVFDLLLDLQLWSLDFQTSIFCISLAPVHNMVTSVLGGNDTASRVGQDFGVAGFGLRPFAFPVKRLFHTTILPSYSEAHTLPASLPFAHHSMVMIACRPWRPCRLTGRT